VFDCAMHKFAGDKARCAKETFRRYDICAKYDPHHPSLIHMCRILPETGYALFGETTDILRINPNITSGMSKGREGETPEEVVERITCYAYRAACPRPVQALADTAKFGDSKTLASPEEVRRRVYTMIGVGVKGLLYRHRGWVDMDTPELDAEIRRLNAEIRQIRSYLSVADVVDWAEMTEGANLSAYSLLAGEKSIVLIVVSHASPTETAKVALALPDWFVPSSASQITAAGQEPVETTLTGSELVLHIPTTEPASAYLIHAEEQRK